MKKSMLEYSKTILSKVSFNAELLKKEYGKALAILSHEEAQELTEWMTNNFLPLNRHRQMGM